MTLFFFCCHGISYKILECKMTSFPHTDLINAYLFAHYQVPLLVELYEIEGNIFRLKVNEIAPLKPRYQVPDVLIKEPANVR